MKRNALFTLAVLVPILAALVSCATTELKLENPETDYNKYPVTTGRNILKAEVTLDGYTLRLEKSITKESDLPSINILNLLLGDESTYSGGRFAFLKGSQKLCGVYVFQKSNMKQSGNQSMGTINRYVYIERGKGDVKEYDISGTFGSDSILSVTEGDVPIGFNVYREPGNKFAGLVSMNSAYKISVGGKTYGILALSRNAALYELKSAALADDAVRDAVMMWALALYEDKSMKSMP